MNETDSFEDLVEQFLDRCRLGDSPEINSFAALYPEHETRLRELLPLLLQMEDCPVDKTRKIPETLSAPPDFAGSDFRLLRKIGSGGMGVVFEALQISLDRRVAIKLLAPSLVANTAQCEAFENEARVIAMLHHPNIVKVLSAGSGPEGFYYAMELIEGKGLDQCKFGDLREIARIGLQAAGALAYAHSCGVIHRDIKMANLLLDSHNELHVSDFGLAYVLRGADEMVEKAGTRSGTLRYMAPERLSEGVNSFAGDQYALGATLYELVTNQPMFPEKNPKELIKRICREPVPPLKCAEPDLAAIINKCVSFQPADRYKSMEALAEDLRRFLNHEPVAAANSSVFRRWRLWVRRKPTVAALSMLSALLVLAFVVALTVGYIRTASALKLAERNAATANETLSNIFAYIEVRTPTASASALLATLMPYYQEIAKQRNLPVEQVAEANKMIGTTALRSGDDRLAETAFRRLSELCPGAFPLNQLAESLRKQGKTQEADAISRQVVEQYSDSPLPADCYEAVRAHLALSEQKQAFEMVKGLLKTDPANPEYRFLYAVILGGNPRLFTERIPGVEPNAVTLLNRLAGENPNRPEYGLELVDLMNRKLRFARHFTDRDWKDLDIALALSDQLLGRFTNTPRVISAVVQLRNGYIGALRRKGDMIKAGEETERLTGMLEILVHNPETPDTARECLIRLTGESVPTP